MGCIEVLDRETASRIAAGEVITRPAAVVKELVENALDAQARHITVEIEEGGKSRIRVVDDGTGMTPEDAPLALLRHATSKIRREEDLLAITTLGFRGEALPSIATVSRLELITRTPGATGGWRLVAEGGEVTALPGGGRARGHPGHRRRSFFQHAGAPQVPQKPGGRAGPDP